MARAQASELVPGARAEVFGIYTDRENYRRLVGPIGATLLRDGTDSRQGAGAVHRVGLGPLGVAEQIVDVEPGRSFTYRAVTRLPVRHYIGTVRFSDHPAGTRVDYELDVEPLLPTPGFSLVVKTMVVAMARGLARGATRELRRRLD